MFYQGQKKISYRAFSLVFVVPFWIRILLPVAVVVILEAAGGIWLFSVPAVAHLVKVPCVL